MEQHPNTQDTRWSKELTRVEHFILTFADRQTARAQGLATSPSSQHDLFTGVEEQFPSCCTQRFPLYCRLEFTQVLPYCCLSHGCLVQLLTSPSVAEQLLCTSYTENCTFSAFLLRQISTSVLVNYQFRNSFSDT